jgi:hypothetical protein
MAGRLVCFPLAGIVKVTLFGHATGRVETGPMRILMDPVLQDPFENGRVVSCPKRVIDLDRLGPIDVVVLPHRRTVTAKRRIDHEISELRAVRG